jgi:hypothetical protein
MAKHERFTFLCDKNERALIVTLAEGLRRSQSDAARFLVGETARELAENRTPTDPSRVVKLTTGEWIALAGLVVAILACIANYLGVPQVQEVIPFFVRGVIPTMNPTLVSPTAIP